MKPEEKARQHIDKMLKASGWIVQDFNQYNPYAGLGIAVREVPVRKRDANTGFTDYMLFVNGTPIGVIEAKKVGTPLGSVSEQSDLYLYGKPIYQPDSKPLRFAYETTGAETFFRDNKDPEPRSRRVFSFHRPETLLEWTKQKDTLRGKLQKLPPLIETGLRQCQIEALHGLEESLAAAKPRALIQMATGSGKTYMAVTASYRLIKHADAKRILFLVDRKSLGKQTLTEFMNYITPDDGRKFTELYNIQHLQSNQIDKVSRVCITTIQRLYSMLSGEPEFDPELEELSIFDHLPWQGSPKEVVYNPDIPIETFDFIITDECHRSIYNLWRQVLEYFDAFLIGLTATPSKQTLGFFNQNLVTEYSHERAVADGVNVGYEVYSIKTKITELGSRVEAGYYIDKRDRKTRKIRYEQLDEDLEYSPNQLDRSVVAVDQIRTIIRKFKEVLLTELFPGRKEVPKTLIFAKDDSHAEDILKIVREEFGRGNDFCKKITYKTSGEKPEDLINAFRNSYNPRIAITVDMISTGTDIKPLECIIFMRDVKSSVYFEQMKGRGTRTISDTDLRTVTPDAKHKTHFVIVDAVGVCESDKTDSRPLIRKRNVPLDKLMLATAFGSRDEDTLTTLAGKLSRFDRQLTEKAREEIKTVAGGKDIKEMINKLLDAVDPDKQIEKAKEMYKIDTPTTEQIKEASEILAYEAAKPFGNPDLRNKIIEIKSKNEQIIDTVSKDEVIFSGKDENAKNSIAKRFVTNFQQFIQENKDELIALQLIYSQPYRRMKATLRDIKKLAEKISAPPYNLKPDLIWQAYEQLEKSKVRGNSQTILTDIVSLIRFASGEQEILEHFPDIIDRRFKNWLAIQQEAGNSFTPEQLEWLEMIKNQIATSLSIQKDDFKYMPFSQKGGYIKAIQVFDGKLEKIMEELNNTLVT